jgi:hypothetical protein
LKNVDNRKACDEIGQRQAHILMTNVEKGIAH